MEFSTQTFKVLENWKKDLSDFDPSEDGGLKKNESVELLDKLKSELFELQDKLYADDKKSLLIIFQAMDAAGKDSAIKHVMSGLNPQGCQVFSFKQPTSEELDHDFLWRHYKALPERGRIGIHNRSHYESVLVCKVHPEFAANESKRPLEEIDNEFWKSRYQSIKNLEKHLTECNTRVVKFFLHLSKKEQKERFLERISNPAKNWKFSIGDLDEREKWDYYMKAYEDAFEHTSTEESPWYIIPADKKWFSRIAICQVLVDTLKSMDLNYPIIKDAGSLAIAKERLQSE